MGLRVLKTPPRSPNANSLCERVIGTLCPECLDFLIPLTEAHLRIVTKMWVAHYNRRRPHTSLGPGTPDPPVDLSVTPHKHRHRIPGHLKVVAHSVPGGLHREYCLVAKAAGIVAEDRYFDFNGLEADWNLVERLSPVMLVNRLGMVLPLSEKDKHVLLETAEPAERLRTFTALLGGEFQAPGSATRHSKHSVLGETHTIGSIRAGSVCSC